MFINFLTQSNCVEPILVYDRPNGECLGARYHPAHCIALALDILAIIAMVAISLYGDSLGTSLQLKYMIQGVAIVEAAFLAFEIKGLISLLLHPNKLLATPDYRFKSKEVFLTDSR